MNSLLLVELLLLLFFAFLGDFIGHPSVKFIRQAGPI